jgi:hypothetical protein
MIWSTGLNRDYFRCTFIVLYKTTDFAKCPQGEAGDLCCTIKLD